MVPWCQIPDRDQVIPAGGRRVETPVADKLFRRDGNTLARLRGDGGNTGLMARPRFHLDEDEYARFRRDDVDLSALGLITHGKNAIALEPQEYGRDGLGNAASPLGLLS